jgi:hypothetical protein
MKEDWFDRFERFGNKWGADSFIQLMLGILVGGGIVSLLGIEPKSYEGAGVMIIGALITVQILKKRGFK